MSGAIFPSDKFSTVTPSDTVKLSYTCADGTILRRCRALLLGGSGNIVIKNEAGTSVTIPVVQGQTIELSTDQVMATSTTVTSITALY